jgi:hypothetical protein
LIVTSESTEKTGTTIERKMIFAEIDYTIPTVAMLMVVYALVDKIIVPLLRKQKSDGPTTDADSNRGRIADTRRRFTAIEADIRENQRLLSTLRSEISVATAILDRLEKR